jgi:hypothetical protein
MIKASEEKVEGQDSSPIPSGRRETAVWYSNRGRTAAERFGAVCLLGLLFTRLLSGHGCELAACARADESNLGQSAGAAHAGRYFAIRVVDQQTGRGVPLVELRTVNDLRFFTDSAGYVAFLEPDLMERKVFFHVSSPGYEFPADGFGFHGKALDVTAGGRAELRLKRLNKAERLYRITGGGIYADSELLGLRRPATPRLPGLVMGSDSVVAAVHLGRVYWFWGDTNRPEYPLGNFHVPGARSPPLSSGQATPDSRIDFEYFVDQQGRAKETARMPGDGPTWIGGLISVPAVDSQPKLLAAYEKIRPPLTVASRGIAEFDESASEFRRVVEFPVAAALRPHGHVFRHREEGIERCYFGDPFPWTRTLATREAYVHLDHYEGYTAFVSERVDVQEVGERLDRDAEGRLVFAWRKGARPWSYEVERRLIAAGKMGEHETLIKLVDAASGKRITPHRGSVNWNPYRQRWIAIFVELGGSTSNLGEVWYAESERPEGPWGDAVKVATHEQYSFYNPRHHAFLDEENGRVLYFEGTYTRTFSGDTPATPRYEYNQILYRLKL